MIELYIHGIYDTASAKKNPEIHNRRVTRDQLKENKNK